MVLPVWWWVLCRGAVEGWLRATQQKPFTKMRMTPGRAGEEELSRDTSPVRWLRAHHSGLGAAEV